MHCCRALTLAKAMLSCTTAGDRVVFCFTFQHTPPPPESDHPYEPTFSTNTVRLQAPLLFHPISCPFHFPSLAPLRPCVSPAARDTALDLSAAVDCVDTQSRDSAAASVYSAVWTDRRGLSRSCRIAHNR